jgi:hypothetical protein
MISLQMGKRRKLIAAGLVLLALPAAFYLFRSIQRNHYVFNEALDLKQRNLAKYRRTVQEKKVVERQLLRLRNTFNQAEAGLLSGKTESLAAAEIQQILTGITGAAGAQIMTVRILQPDRSAGEIYLAIPVEITINATMRQLTQLLYKLDGSARLLRIVKLGIRLPGGRGRFVKGANSVNILATLTVEGFVKQGEV